MSSFIGNLQLDFGDWGRAGRIAVLLCPVIWQSDGMAVTIPAGEMSDGASVPQFLWWFMPPWGDRASFAAILHDYLSLRLLDGVPVTGATTRAQIDRQFYRALKALGLPEWRARLAWLGVRANSISYELTGWPAQRFADQSVVR